MLQVPSSRRGPKPKPRIISGYTARRHARCEAINLREAAPAHSPWNFLVLIRSVLTEFFLVLTYI